MAFLWDPTPFMAKSPEDAATEFLTDWVQLQYGAEATSVVLGVIQDYFKMPWLRETTATSGRPGGKVRTQASFDSAVSRCLCSCCTCVPTCSSSGSGSSCCRNVPVACGVEVSFLRDWLWVQWLGEGDLAQDLRKLAAQLTGHIDPTVFPPGFPWATACGSPGGGCPLPTAAAAAAAALSVGAATTGAVYGRAKALLPRLPADRRQFFASHTLTQLAIWHYTASALRNVSDAVGAVGRNEYSLAGGAVCRRGWECERRVHGVWAGWHMHDWLDGFSSLRLFM